MKKLFFTAFIINFIFVADVFSHGGGGEMGGNVGPKKGVQAVSHEEGMTIAPAAVKRLDLQTTTLEGNPPWIVSKEGLIFSKDDKFVYLAIGNKYKSIQVEATSVGNGNYKINSWKLKTQDQIVIKGTSLLRIAELDAGEGEEEDEHDEHNHGSEKHEDKHDHAEEGHHD